MLKIVIPLLIVLLSFVYIVKNTKKKFLKYTDTYISEGLAIGLCLGTALAITISREYLSYGISIGMLLGLIVGHNIKRK